MQAEPEIEDQIMQILNQFAKLCARKDVSGCLSLFAHDADVVGLGSEEGERAVGQKELRLFFERVFARPVDYSFEWLWHLVSVAGPVAWATVEGMIHIDDSITKNLRRSSTPYRMTAVFERRDSRWFWTQMHGSIGVQPFEGKMFKSS